MGMQATAGLRTLKGDTSDRILQAVSDMLKNRSTLYVEPDAVSVLSGKQEGAYQWVTINYLLGNLGKHYSKTVAIVDLGGGSVQMAYAISEKDAAKAPEAPEGVESYITEMVLKGKKYYLYVHSYLRFGLLAARAEVLKVSDGSENPCILAGFDGYYKYGGVEYKATAPPSGSSFNECKQVVLEALNVNATCTYKDCSFNGTWNGGGGDGENNLFVASFFYEVADEAGFVDPDAPNAKVRPVDFADAANIACKTELKDLKSVFPRVKDGDVPYICLDLVYQYTLLVDGFGMVFIILIGIAMHGSSAINYIGEANSVSGFSRGSSMATGMCHRSHVIELILCVVLNFLTLVFLSINCATHHLSLVDRYRICAGLCTNYWWLVVLKHDAPPKTQSTLA
ncbi:hypothetical protein VNO77_16762 [Canavalia gladiata]|uniref:Apyrase n=1 Tax=Canavalia gladiata TaxID=3824 RepID=A0AAN9QI45_CANGL